MVRRIASGWQAFALVLVAWGNAAAALAGTAMPVAWTGVALGLALIAVSLLWARGRGLTREEVGLGSHGVFLGAAAGLAFALLAVAGALLVLLYPPLFGEAVSYGPLATASETDLARRVLLTMPLDTILPEEVAFRGVLLGALLRRYAVERAVVLSALAFAAWHAVIVSATVAETNLSVAGLFGAIGTAAAFLAVFCGGVVFAVFRIRLGGLAAPIAAHWAFNAALLLGLKALQI